MADEPQPLKPIEPQPEPTQDTLNPVEKQQLEKQDENRTEAQNPVPEAPEHEQQRNDRVGAPLKLDPEDGETIHLPTLVSDEFGVSVIQAEKEIRLSDVTLDGVEYTSRTLHVPVEDIRNKELLIKGQSRTFRIFYDN